MKNHAYILTSTIIALALTARQGLAQSNYDSYTFNTLAGYAGYGSADVPAGVRDGSGMTIDMLKLDHRRSTAT